MVHRCKKCSDMEVNSRRTPTLVFDTLLQLAAKLESCLMLLIIVVYIRWTFHSIVEELVKVTVFDPQPFVYQNTAVFPLSQKTRLNFSKLTMCGFPGVQSDTANGPYVCLQLDWGYLWQRSSGLYNLLFSDDSSFCVFPWAVAFFTKFWHNFRIWALIFSGQWYRSQKSDFVISPQW